MIAVTGANGQLGRLVIDALLKRVAASQIVALVRTPEQADELVQLGVELRYADYDKPETLNSALEGVSKLLLISGNMIGERVRQHTAVITAAQRAGVTLLAYTSILHADTSPLLLSEEHQVTEQLIIQSGLPYVLLRNGWYNENYSGGIAGSLAVGAITGAMHEGRIASAARADYAEAAAVVLTDPGHVGKTYELAGDESFSLQTLAEQAAELSGKTLLTNYVSEQQYAEFLAQVGVPARFAALLADAEIQANSGWLNDQSGTLSTLIGRPTTPMRDSLTQHLTA
ncbi:MULTISPECIES: SDR family oxidoreductase [unclassified Pseudoalteromonas]|uniref:SDR family oxidoreductase n=1 Tax=unclassified Pseudoalteromonas TaxID=194690 RepID=UPI00209775B4|nr:SDR family oxidoreductase [Pseudoalteromonas sp. XMcav2-N]MCO7190836.1 SDR family oxidoreductase [Pseudoalteromonas sp. XMcav2-N]